MAKKMSPKGDYISSTVMMRGKRKTYNGKEYTEFVGSVVLPSGHLCIISLNEKYEGGFVSKLKDRKTGDEFEGMFARISVSENKGGQ